MIKNIGCNNSFHVICNKCGRFTPTVRFSQIRDMMRNMGWYSLDISPSKSTPIDICDTCAKKYTLAQLG